MSEPLLADDGRAGVRRPRTTGVDVSAVVVTYNSSAFLEDCLAGFRAGVGCMAHELVVVDNASHDGCVELVRALRPDAIVVDNDSNTGFAAASNQGIRASEGRYIVLLNPDAMAAPGSMARLVEYMDGHPRCGIAGPMLHDPDGSLQFSVRNFPTPTNQLFESLFLHHLASGMSVRFGEVVCDPRAYTHSGPVEWVSGAVMILRPEALAEVGLLDEGYFMYSEEKDLCLRTNAAGWSVDYVCDAHVVHGHGDRVSPAEFARMLRSNLRYIDKHTSGLRKIALQATYFLGFFTRVAAGLCAAVVRSPRRHNLLVPIKGLRLFFSENRRAVEVGRGAS